MIYNNVEEIYQTIDKTRAKLIETVSVVSDEKGKARGNGEGWSVAEIVEHLGIVEDGITRIINKMLENAEKDGKKSDGTFNPPLSLVKYAETANGQKYQAPERIHPQGFQSLEKSLAKLSENRTVLRTLQTRIESVDSTEPKFPHPSFGNLNLYEWLAFIGLHEFRHLQQIKRILGN